MSLTQCKEVNNIFEVILEFTDTTYMEIEQVRDYGIQDVVGDVGGYLGLFLGFALLQIPEVIFTIISWIKDILRLKHSKVEQENSVIKYVNSPQSQEGQCYIELEKIRKELKDIQIKLQNQ